jgi:hypothetical protein
MAGIQRSCKWNEGRGGIFQVRNIICTNGNGLNNYDQASQNGKDYLENVGTHVISPVSLFIPPINPILIENSILLYLQRCGKKGKN